MVSELSILIPVYNRSVIQLVQQLAQQANTLSIPVEIRVYDDGSTEYFRELNQLLGTLSQVFYKELPVNVGRSRIRYLLAQEARYKTLLFLDNDVLMVYSNFLENYVSQHQGSVTVGGICYQETPPASEFYLRWLYGKTREQATAKNRKHSPYARVFLSNLLVEKELFQKYFQHELVTTYGHEDTLLAAEFQKNQIPITHIDNPVEHLGLDSASVFLEKTKAALQNLAMLQKDGLLVEESRL